MQAVFGDGDVLSSRRRETSMMTCGLCTACFSSTRRSVPPARILALAPCSASAATAWPMSFAATYPNAFIRSVPQCPQMPGCSSPRANRQNGAEIRIWAATNNSLQNKRFGRRDLDESGATIAEMPFRRLKSPFLRVWRWRNVRYLDAAVRQRTPLTPIAAVAVRTRGRTVGGRANRLRRRVQGNRVLRPSTSGCIRGRVGSRNSGRHASARHW